MYSKILHEGDMQLAKTFDLIARIHATKRNENESKRRNKK